MTEAITHIIHKVFVEVDTTTSAKAFEIKDGASDFVQQKVLSHIEDYIARYQDDFAELSIQLDRIELNINTQSLESSPLTFQSEIESQLNEVFQPLLIEKETLKAKDQIQPHSRAVESEQDTQEYEILSPELRTMKTFFYFIKNGTTPWWVPTNDAMSTLMKEENVIEVIQKNRLKFIERLNKEIKDFLFRDRLIHQLSPELILFIIASRLLKQPIEFQKIIALYEKQLIQIKAKSAQERVQIWIALLEVENFNSSNQSSNKTIESEVSLEEEKQLKIILQKIISQSSDSIEEKAKEEDQIEEKTEDSIDFISENVGLVLLSPFMKPFLKDLELLNEENQLTDPEQTVFILHYLATGEESALEFEMTFEKFLCQVPLNRTLPKEWTLTDLQKEKCEALLKSVLSHWKALRSESIPLLQNEFLKREGKIILEEEQPRIVVERKTIDLLLDQLPWNISMLKLPWRDHFIFVEW